MNVLTELAVPLGNSVRRRGESWRRICVPAASLAFVVALAVVLTTRQPAIESFPASNGSYATEVGQQRTDTLADGSQVVLNTNSLIKVDYSGGYRKVYLLQGEALFTVAKDATRPFRVYAGSGRIEALGTAFSVYLNGADVDVAVTEGRVSLASVAGAGPELDDGVMASLGTLAAGHVATIRSPEAAPESVAALDAIRPIAPDELAQRLAWRDGVLVFSGETLEEVIQEFSRYTTLTIEIPDAAVRQMRIGGRFPAGETETMLATLQTNFHLRVTRLGHDRVSIDAVDP